MKFYIRSSILWESPDRIIEHYPGLHEFGFAMHEVPDIHKIRIFDENGKPMYTEVYKTKWLGSVTINDLERLIALQKMVKCEIIVDEENGEPWIEIYDGYRE